MELFRRWLTGGQPKRGGGARKYPDAASRIVVRMFATMPKHWAPSLETESRVHAPSRPSLVGERRCFTKGCATAKLRHFHDAPDAIASFESFVAELGYSLVRLDRKPKP